MNRYVRYLALRFITSLKIEKNYLPSILIKLFFMIMFIVFYYLFLKNDDLSSFNKIVSYLWLNLIFFSVLYNFYKNDEIEELVSNDGFLYELLKPKSLYLIWFLKIVGQRLAYLTLRVIILVVALVIPYPFSLSLPVSFLSCLAFILSIIITILLISALITLYHVLTLSKIGLKYTSNIFLSVNDILNGRVVPKKYFPVGVQNSLSILLGGFSFGVYAGYILPQVALKIIFIQFLAFILVVLLTNVTFKKIIKRILIMGTIDKAK